MGRTGGSTTSDRVFQRALWDDTPREMAAWFILKKAPTAQAPDGRAARSLRDASRWTLPWKSLWAAHA